MKLSPKIRLEQTGADQSDQHPLTRQAIPQPQLPVHLPLNPEGRALAVELISRLCYSQAPRRDRDAE